MTLSAGQRLGPFSILARIGAGGMGEVWRARDTRLALVDFARDIKPILEKSCVGCHSGEQRGEAATKLATDATDHTDEEVTGLGQSHSDPCYPCYPWSRIFTEGNEANEDFVSFVSFCELVACLSCISCDSWAVPSVNV
jgi:hypothetical protein